MGCSASWLSQSIYDETSTNQYLSDLVNSQHLFYKNVDFSFQPNGAEIAKQAECHLSKLVLSLLMPLRLSLGMHKLLPSRSKRPNFLKIIRSLILILLKLHQSICVSRELFLDIHEQEVTSLEVLAQEECNGRNGW